MFFLSLSLFGHNAIKAANDFKCLWNTKRLRFTPKLCSGFFCTLRLRRDFPRTLICGWIVFIELQCSRHESLLANDSLRLFFLLLIVMITHRSHLLLSCTNRSRLTLILLILPILTLYKQNTTLKKRNHIECDYSYRHKRCLNNQPFIYHCNRVSGNLLIDRTIEPN